MHRGMLAFALLWSASAPGAAQGVHLEHASLSVTGDAAPGCIDVRALREAVAHRVGDGVFGEPSEGRMRLQVAISRHGRALEATVEILHGETRGTRTLTANSCTDLEDALSLVLALTLTTELEASTRDEPENLKEVEVEKEVENQKQVEAVTEKGAEAGASADRGLLALVAGITDGLTPRLAPVLALDLQWRPAWAWPQQLGIAYLITTEAHRGDVTAGVDVITGELLTCPVTLAARLLGCAGLRGALVRAEGEAGLGVPVSRTATEVQPLARLEGSLSLTGSLAVHVRAAMGISLLRPEFVFHDAFSEERTIFRVSPVSWEAAAGLSLALF